MRARAFALLALAALAASAHADSPATGALDPFFARLKSSGRAELHIVRETRGPHGAVSEPGRVALEPPDRVRLEFTRTGERVTLRNDGGEWLQPELKQCVHLGPERARAALEWWDLLLGRDRAAFQQHALEKSRVLLVHAQPDLPPDSVWVALDGASLPARIDVRPADAERESYKLSGWKFAHARGRADFVLATPAGYESVDLK